MPDDRHEHEIIGAGDPRVENDPEVLAEERRLRIKQLRLQYYKDLAGTVKVFLQTFKTEAMSLVSGISTLVLGYYEVKRWVLKGHREPGWVAHKQELMQPAKPGSSGDVKIGVSISGVPDQLQGPNFVHDPVFYTLLICGVAFGASSFKWVFRRDQGRKEKGEFHGPL